MLGKYPNRLAPTEAPADVGLDHGRVLPTTSWEALWNGVSEWFGVSPEDLPYVLPNAAKFPGQLFSQAELFM